MEKKYAISIRKYFSISSSKKDKLKSFKLVEKSIKKSSTGCQGKEKLALWILNHDEYKKVSESSLTHVHRVTTKFDDSS